MKTDRRENLKFIVTNFKDRFTSYITITYPNMFFFLDYLLFLSYFCYYLLLLKLLLIEHVFVCWKRYSTKTIVVLILKYLAQQTNTYSKSAAETLKQEVKSVKS